MWRFPSHLSRNNPHSRHRQVPLQIFIMLPCPGLCRTREKGVGFRPPQFEGAAGRGCGMSKGKETDLRLQMVHGTQLLSLAL